MNDQTTLVYFSRKPPTVVDAVSEIIGMTINRVRPTAIPTRDIRVLEIDADQRAAFMKACQGDHAFLGDAVAEPEVIVLRCEGHVDIWIDRSGYSYARYVGYSQDDCRAYLGLD